MRDVARSLAVAVLLAMFVALVVAACGPPAGGGQPTAPPSLALTSGIRGVVLLGPTCGAQPADASPCVTPYLTELVITDDSGSTVGKVTSGNDGRFEIALPPGSYVIQPAPGQGGVPFAIPVPVTVVADDYAEVEVDYDSGIR